MGPDTAFLLKQKLGLDTGSRVREVDLIDGIRATVKREQAVSA
jgi:hypothetical protein